MANRLIFSVSLMIGAVAHSSAALAKTIYFGSSVETVPIGYGRSTILRFEEAVKTISNADDFIIKPASEENPDYSVLVVEPRVLSGRSDTVFMLANGEIAKLRLSIVPKGAKTNNEGIFDIKSRNNMVNGPDEKPVRDEVTQLDLMTAMIRGDLVRGYETSRPMLDVSRGSESTQLTLVKLYTGEQFKGYIYEITNKSNSKTFEIDVRKLRFGTPNLALLAYTDREELGTSKSGQSKSRLIIVTKPGAHASNAVLPIRVAKDNKPGGAAHD